MSIGKDIIFFQKIFFIFIFIFILLFLLFFIINPFILSFAWACIIVISTWPILLFIERLLWNKRFLAVFIMLFILLFLFIFPIIIIVNSIIYNIFPLINIFKGNHICFPKLFWLMKIPFFGEKILSSYNKLVSSNNINILNKLNPYLGKLTEFFIFHIRQFTNLLLNIILTLVFIVFLYFKGEKLSSNIKKFIYIFFSNQGLVIFYFIEKSIRFIVLGVLFTALIQGILSGIGLMIFNIPYSSFFTLLAILFSLLQIGSLPILFASIIFLYLKGDIFYGSMLFTWSIIIAVFDSVLRLILIKINYDLPFFLIIIGILGGFLSFGIIGIFIGPVVLDILYRSINLFFRDN